MASRTLERKKRIDYKKMIQGEPWISDNEVEEEDKLSSATVLEVPKPCGISGENQASEEKDESDVETMKEELLMLEKEEKLLQAQQEKALLRQKLREKREAIKALKVQVKTDFHQTNDKERIPSKRPDKDISDADQFDNAYNTTPGFRKHVSKKLSEALDSVIDTSCEYFGKSVDNAEEDSGVKLFSSSKLVLQLDSSQVESGKPVNKRHLPSSSDSSSEDERLAEASVSHDFVLQQSNLPYLTNQKAADIIINQADPAGVANKNNNPTDNSNIHTKIKHDSDKEKTKNYHIDKKEEISECSIKKHKKKKKKKKKKHKKGVD